MISLLRFKSIYFITSSNFPTNIITSIIIFVSIYIINLDKNKEFIERSYKPDVCWSWQSINLFGRFFSLDCFIYILDSSNSSSITFSTSQFRF